MNTSYLVCALAGTLVATAFGQPHQLVKKWETEALLKTPESVLFDAGARVLYVANIDGKEPWTKDGAGSIGKVGLDGKIIAAEWVKGLEAPKGMGLSKGKLYVADIDRMAVIDVAKGAIAEFIAIPGAQQLNDVTVDKTGVVYVSDMKGLKIYAIRNGKPEVFLEGFKRPNGVLAQGDDFYVLDSGALLKFSKGKQRTTVVEGMDPSTDGIEHVQGNEFIVSCWAGAVYYVKGGEKQQLLDTRTQKINSADIGYDPKGKVVYVPTFFVNTVAAYELK
ncbi:SMP-30/gluconolactonase/LRE family protein [Horticoccus sp. 23ND18S-11]|uniref:SMP-30/gluconolactonase/LRE family protein n=1 Tax=Horticoccus sp. 23ND18S-11 TaxID=3391832 RepID=UPI0039C904AE